AVVDGQPHGEQFGSFVLVVSDIVLARHRQSERRQVNDTTSDCSPTGSGEPNSIYAVVLSRRLRHAIPSSPAALGTISKPEPTEHRLWASGYRIIEDLPSTKWRGSKSLAGYTGRRRAKAKYGSTGATRVTESGSRFALIRSSLNTDRWSSSCDSCCCTV